MALPLIYLELGPQDSTLASGTHVTAKGYILLDRTKRADANWTKLPAKGSRDA